MVIYWNNKISCNKLNLFWNPFWGNVLKHKVVFNKFNLFFKCSKWLPHCWWNNKFVTLLRSPGFESQAHHHLHFCSISIDQIEPVICCWDEKRTKISEKEAGISPSLKNILCKKLNLIFKSRWRSVWPDKNRQMSVKVAQKWFH